MAARLMVGAGLQPPEPPEKPLPMDCCDSGCAVCVFDAYAQALAAYEKELAVWKAQVLQSNAGRKQD